MASSFVAPLVVALGLALQPSPSPLTGVVEDQSGGALADALVTLDCADTVSQVRTDADGRFVFDAVPARACTVTAERAFFDPVSLRVDGAALPGQPLELTLRVQGFASEVVVTPGRGVEEATFDVPEAVSVTTREEIEARPHQLLPQVLKEEPGVLLQQTTTAQASPFIRGFSAQRIVYLLDGVRFNTSVFRTGATQYLGWIAPQTVDRMEVVRGPASVQYGSDALGGTVNVISLKPQLTRAGTSVSGGVGGLLGSADRSAAGDAHALFRGTRGAVQVGGSTRRVDDLRPGDGRDSHAAVTRFLGLPSETLGNRLRNTGFQQRGVHLLGRVRAGEGFVDAAYLHEQQFGVHRYDRELGGDGLHRSEFEPQRLDVALARYERASAGPLDAIRIGISLNRQQDDRLEQRRPTSRIERESTRVRAIGYHGQATRRIGSRHAVTFGGELYDEHIGASRSFEIPATGERTTVRPRIPDDTRYRSMGLYVQDAADLLPGRMSVRGGVRYGRFTFRTLAAPAQGVEAERVSVDAVTFHSGAVIQLAPALRATLTASRGFRAANALDLGAIGISGGGFEISPRAAAALGANVGTTDGALAVDSGRPVGDLGPETLLAYEAGLKLQADRLDGTLTLFDLELSNIIQRRTAIFGAPVVGRTIAGFGVARQDAAGRAFIAQDPRPIVTRVNVDRARVRGIEASLSARLTQAWRLGGYVSMANGRELGSDVPLRRMPPPLGGLHVRYEPRAQRYWVEGTAQFAWRQTRLSPGDLGDARIGGRRSRESIAAFFDGAARDLGLVREGVLLATGETLDQVQQRVLGDAESAPLFTSSPGFLVFGARAGLSLTSHASLILMAENLTDRNYRWHGSGVDGAGFNLQARIRYRF